ncbi:hypothetical protein OPV22_020710 [Ensete ventricosum]|uniref:DUF4005 domain-containing protein n=1 Tax=Ensete ventricosum TaxID=4639 RepID=A0AAV8QQM7_ENSVE|nr:hypothetical protein OPV22_020710 [Ensete ventricosum]
MRRLVTDRASRPSLPLSERTLAPHEYAENGNVDATLTSVRPVDYLWNGTGRAASMHGELSTHSLSLLLLRRRSFDGAQVGAPEKEGRKKSPFPKFHSYIFPRAHGDSSSLSGSVRARGMGSSCAVGLSRALLPSDTRLSKSTENIKPTHPGCSHYLSPRRLFAVDRCD